MTNDKKRLEADIVTISTVILNNVDLFPADRKDLTAILERLLPQKENPMPEQNNDDILRNTYDEDKYRDVVSKQTDLEKYEISEDMQKRLDNDFAYHPPTPDQIARYPHIRSEAKALAVTLCKLCPPSRELSLALTHLEEAVMFANASIARNETTNGFPEDDERS